MIKVTCECGTCEMTFRHLTEADFPTGFFRTICCDELDASDVPAPTLEEILGEEVSPDAVAVETDDPMTDGADSLEADEEVVEDDAPAEGVEPTTDAPKKGKGKRKRKK